MWNMKYQLTPYGTNSFCKFSVKPVRIFKMKGRLDGGCSWLVVLGSFISQFIVMGIHQVFGVLYIDLLQEFGENKAGTGKNLQRSSVFSLNAVMFHRYLDSEDTIWCVVLYYFLVV